MKCAVRLARYPLDKCIECPDSEVCKTRWEWLSSLWMRINNG